MKIKKGDKVTVIKGKDKGKTAVVEKSMPKAGKVIVTGVNVYKKSAKPSQKHPKGGIMNISAPISAANVMVVCPKCSKATRVGYKITQNNKIRVCKKCQESLDVKS